MRSLIFILFITGSLLPLKAQDSTQIASDIMALAQSFRQAEGWHIEQEIIMRDRKSGEILDREKTETYGSGALNFTRQFSEEILVQDPYLVKVDNQSREITVEPYTGTAITSFPLEEYFQLYQKLEFSETETEKIYYLGLKNYYIYSEIQLRVDKESELITRLTIYPKYPMTVKGKEREVQLDIEYRNIDLKPEGLDKILTASRYFTSRGKKLQLTSSYRDYTLINRLNP